MKTKRNWVSLVVFMLGFHPTSQASKLDLYFGAFDFSAKTATGEGSVSGAGAYKLGFYLPLFENFEAGIGYSLILSDMIGGDSAFGLDIEGAYFPLTSVGPSIFSNDRVSARIESVWRPFVLVGYHARQFQSVSTQYTGLSVGGGTERAFDARYSFKALFRYATMAGANEGEATELTIMGGLSFQF